jgi:uncharacterized membrane protein YdjX (TVP38/TMEM64 family)
MDDNMNRTKVNWTGRNFKILAFLLLVGLLLCVHICAPDLTKTLFRLAKGGSLEETTAYLRSFGPWAILVSFLLDVLINALGFLPSIFLSTANGVIFGLPIGITVSWLAETVGVVLNFLVLRFFLRDEAEKIIAKSNNLKRLDEMSSEKGLTAMALARTLPYFPSGILTALGAVSRMSVRDYIIANLIGKFPSTALEVVVGHDVVNFHNHMHRLAVLMTAVIIVYGTMLYVKHKKDKKDKEKKEQGHS